MIEQMYSKIDKSSLIRKFLKYTLFIISIILLLSIWLSVDFYNFSKQEQLDFTKKEAQKLALVFDEKITVLEHILRFIGNKIKDSPSKSAQSIAEIIRSHPTVFKGESIIWHIIYYVNPQGDLIASSINGTDVSPIHVDESMRSWVKTASDMPWHLKYSKPDTSLVTSDFVIPAALGICRDGNFYGYLSANISIAKLKALMMAITSDDIGFLVFDRDGNFVLSSDDQLMEQINQIDPSLYQNVDGLTQFKRPLKVGDYLFSFAINSKHFPLVIIVGQNSNYLYSEINRSLLPRLFLYTITGIIFVILLGIIAYKVLSPILALNRMAVNISRNEQYMPLESEISEFDNLSKQMQKISFITKDLRNKQILLAKANNDLESANAFIKSNMSFLSHELINPVSTIIGFSEMVKDKIKGSKDHELIEFIDIISKASSHLNKQLNYFLKLFKFQESRKAIEIREINMRELMEWNLSMVKRQADEKGVKVTIETTSDLKVYADEIMLGQIIQNFASNGIKYNKEDGLLTVRAFADNNDLIIEFEDTGTGISKGDIDKIFKKFSRLKNAKQVIGYGVGLAYAKHCIMAHNGKIKIKSKLGRGTKFIVTIPNAVNSSNS